MSISDVNTTLDWGHVIRDDRFKAAVLKGYISIPEDGVYFFSSDQNEVWIAGEKIIDNNGEVKRFSRNDASIALAKGFHELKIVYLNNVFRGWASDWNRVKLEYRHMQDNKFAEVGPEMIFRSENKLSMETAER